MKHLALIFLALVACQETPPVASLAAAPAAADFGIAGVKALIREHPEATTGEALLALLPDELRSQYTLLYTSRSLQEARPLAPRVVLYSERFFVGFNGAAGERGYDRFELMEYDARAKRFRLAEVRFAADEVPVLAESPPVCAVCHGQEPRPLWNPYPLWPGAYDNDDQMEFTGQSSRNLDAFLAAAPTLDRYRQLLGLEGFRARSPSRELANRLRDAATAQIRDRLVPESRYIGAFRYFLAGSDRCDEAELAGFIPPALAGAFAADWPQVEADTADRQVKMHDAETERARSMAGYQPDVDIPFMPVNFSDSGRRVTAALRYVLERDGGSIGGWFPTIGGASYRLPRDLYALSQLVPDDLLPSGGCDQLRAKSQAALSGDVAGLLATGLPRTRAIDAEGLPRDELLAQTYRFVAENCASCHADGAGVPAIPFERPADLNALLKQGPLEAEIERRLTLASGATGAMPPSGALAGEVLQNFLAALKALSP